MNKSITSMLGGDLGVSLISDLNQKRREQQISSLQNSNQKMKHNNTELRQMFLNPIWSTEKLAIYDELLENGENDILPSGFQSPYYQNIPGIKRPRIVFEYTNEELKEIQKCAEDVIYFADKYCYTMTDDGVMKIKLRKYQKRVLKSYQENRFCVFLSPRQIGKTVMSSIFIDWFLMFHSDKNCLIVANKADTMYEIIDKIRVVYETLPYFLKPGVLSMAQSYIKFENRCRLFGQATTATPGLGFTVHMLYADEFAHIPSNIVEAFWKSIYPTLSSSKISRCIVTSTANGMNKFYDLYDGGIKKLNDFHAIRVDWWEVPGRDEEWKQRETANLGSKASFDQEYGNHFYHRR